MVNRTFPVEKLDERVDEQTCVLADPCRELDWLLDSMARRIARQVRTDMHEEKVTAQNRTG